MTIAGVPTALTTTEEIDPASGLVTGQVDQGGLRTDVTYDPLGRITAVWKPGHSKSVNAQADAKFEYTVNTGSPSVVASRRLLASGQYATSYALFDGLGRTVQTQSPTSYALGGRVLTDTLHDSQGRVWKTHASYWNSAAPGPSLHVVQDNAVPNTTETRYDSAGRATAVLSLRDGFEQWRTTTTYDGDRVTTIPPLGGTASAVVNNGLGQKVMTQQFEDRAHTGPTDHLQPHRPGPALNYADADDPKQVSTTHTYDDFTTRIASTLAVRATTTDQYLANRAYTYNHVGDVTEVDDTATAAADNQCFGYDHLRRLTSAWTPSSGDCGVAPSVTGLGGPAPYWTDWSYDTTGNRKTQTKHIAATTNPSGAETTATYGDNEVGSTVARPGHELRHDQEGRVAADKDLATGKESTYLYDADGKRLISKEPAGTTLYLVDMELFVPTGTTTAVGTRFYTHGGENVARRTAGKITWTVEDHQGTALCAVDAATLAVTKRYQDPFGVTRGPQPGSWPDRHGFIGGVQDPGGTVHLGAREYDPALGRFTAVDPVLDQENPQQWNGYAYAGNNPVTFSDPTGLIATCGVDGAGCPTPNRDSCCGRSEDAGTINSPRIDEPSLNDIVDTYQVIEDPLPMRKIEIEFYGFRFVNVELTQSEMDAIGALASRGFVWDFGCNAQEMANIGPVMYTMHQLEKAAAEADQRFGGDFVVAGKRDAFRHAYWSALIAQEYDSSFAAEFTTAHERKVDSSALQEAMDLYNNRIGRLIAATSNGEDLADTVFKHVNAGSLVAISNDYELVHSNEVAERATYDQSGEPRLHLPGSVPDALPCALSEGHSCTVR